MCLLSIIAALIGTVPILQPRAVQRRQRMRLASAMELVIATKEAPPFSMKVADGTWQGISVDLWRRVAENSTCITGSSKSQTCRG